MTNIYSSAKQFVGLAKETTHGTAVDMVTTMPVEEFTFEESREQLADKAWRGHMGDNSGIVQGVGKTEFGLKGPVFLDTIGHLLLNILGDVTSSGTTPKTHAFSLLNSGSGQPASHTFTHSQGPGATSGARKVAGACLSELTFKWNAESELFTVEGKGTGWTSALLGSAPTSAPSTVVPLAAWRATLGIGGPASGGTLAKNVSEAEISIKRALSPKYTISGTQDPYIVARGTVDVTGKFTFIADSEAPLLAFLNHSQPQAQLIIGNGGSGGSLQQLQVDIDKATYSSSKLSGGNELIEYESEFTSVSTATNAGASGGFSPAKFTLTNAVASY